jgi:hypothetical protein
MEPMEPMAPMGTIGQDDRRAGELADARIVEFPLRGDWKAVHSPGSRIPSHGTDILGQRFAFDLIRLGGRNGNRYHPASALRLVTVGVRTRDCYGWGEPVHAVLPGKVVAASDAMPERERIQVLAELARVIWNGLTFRPGKIAQMLGNHVILQHGDCWCAYAHLVPGSVSVAVGQEVAAGTVLGRVGHTGNSTAPHLHVQLMDSPDALAAHGVPCAFAAYEVETPSGWQRVERSIPLATEHIRSVPVDTP